MNRDLGEQRIADHLLACIVDCWIDLNDVEHGGWLPRAGSSFAWNQSMIAVSTSTVTGQITDAGFSACIRSVGRLIENPGNIVELRMAKFEVRKLGPADCFFRAE
jgi:hypothetical protein